MVTPYALVGAASELADAPERIRQRRLENENRELTLADRERRIAREDDADARTRTRFDREQQDWQHQDTLRSMDMSDRLQRDAEHIEDRARKRKLDLRADTAYEEDRDFTKKDRGLKLSEARKEGGRKDVLWARSEEERKKKMRDEGMEDMLNALEKNVDPHTIEREFNSRGELRIQPGTLQFDPASRQLRFVDTDGDTFDGSIDQLKAIFVAPKAPIKLGKNDRLVDPVTKKEVIGPSSGAGADGEDVSPWNRQTASDRASDVVREAFGLRFDSEMNSWNIPQGMSEKVTKGVSTAGQVTRHFGSRISPEEAGAIAFEAMREYPTLKDAQAQAAREGAKTQKDLADKTAQIMRAAAVHAAQKLDMLLADKERELEQREAAKGGLSSADSAGGRPPLSSFGATQQGGDRPPLSAFQR